MQIFQSYYETLYQRPVVRLAGYSARHGLPASLYAYLAAGGPTNSAKDALAEGMLAIATEKGLLKPGQTVVEGSSGSFAVALAISCAAGTRWYCACRRPFPQNASTCWQNWAPKSR